MSRLVHPARDALVIDMRLDSLDERRSGMGRRHFAGGMIATAGGLAALIQYGPEWGAGAPSRPTPMPTPMPEVALPVLPPPHPIQYSATMRAEWLAFRNGYMTPDGRIVDTGNNSQSHSEGQGWGLMAAQAADDPQMFATILDWTQRNLQRRSDALHAWRYRPNDPNPVSDLNNATDGDLFIAAALARAAMRWNRPDYAHAAARIGRDILGLVRQAGSRTVLLPAAVGFEKPDAITVNPSYYAFALFPDLAALAPSPLWAKLQQDGLATVLEGRFGHWGLPPDWMRVDRRTGALSVSPGWPPRFSYDAIRVPLHLAWAGLPGAPALDAFRDYWQAGRGLPAAWVDLRTQETAPYAAPPGFQAVAAVALRSNSRQPYAIPFVKNAKDYYSAGLILLSHMAVGEAGLVA